MHVRPLLSVLLIGLVVFSTMQVAAQGDIGDDATDGCGPTVWPCWVLGVLGLTAAMFLVVVLRTVMLARRIARGPSERRQDDLLPPDLADAEGPVAEASPPATFPPAHHAPWPDERHDPPTMGATRSRLSRPIKDGSAGQVTWGDHRLWFDDGRYFFSLDADGDPDWLPCFSIPKGHRVVVGADGEPRLERYDPRHPPSTA